MTSTKDKTATTSAVATANSVRLAVDCYDDVRLWSLLHYGHSNFFCNPPARIVDVASL